MYPCILEICEQLHLVCWNVHRNLSTLIEKKIIAVNAFKVLSSTWKQINLLNLAIDNFYDI